MSRCYPRRLSYPKSTLTLHPSRTRSIRITISYEDRRRGIIGVMRLLRTRIRYVRLRRLMILVVRPSVLHFNDRVLTIDVLLLDFCLWAPPQPNSTIANTEAEEVAWCTKKGHGTREHGRDAERGVWWQREARYLGSSRDGTVAMVMMRSPVRAKDAKMANGGLSVWDVCESGEGARTNWVARNRNRGGDGCRVVDWGRADYLGGVAGSDGTRRMQSAQRGVCVKLGGVRSRSRAGGGCERASQCRSVPVERPLREGVLVSGVATERWEPQAVCEDEEAPL